MNIIPRRPYRILTGDVREMLRTLPDESVYCVVTSPPYWGLRDYGIKPNVWDGDLSCSHIWISAPQGVSREQVPGSKQATSAGSPRDRITTAVFCEKCSAWRGQLGLEPTIELYVQHMVEVFREVRRVLRKDGTLWLNMGDCYAASKGNMGDRGNDNKGNRNANFDGSPHRKASYRRDRLPRQDDTHKVVSSLKPKDLVGQPWRVAFALQADGWWLRSDIVWAKPNPMPESCRDRPTKSHEYVFMLTKAAKYFFDQEAIREAHATPEKDRQSKAGRRCLRGQESIRPRGNLEVVDDASARYYSPGGRNIRSVWTIPTQAFPDAHFATFPEALPERCIKAGTSERGCCPECGAPWVRVVEKSTPNLEQQRACGGDKNGVYTGTSTKEYNGTGAENPSEVKARILAGMKHKTTTGWRPSCEHKSEPIPCTVLDPFVGSGTTALVAIRLGRRAIGIDLNPEYTDMVEKQLAVAIRGGYRRPRKFKLKGRKKMRRLSVEGT